MTDMPSEFGIDEQVNHPPHYTQGSIECLDAIRAALTPEEFRGYIKSNVLKYIWRERLKGGDKDLAKAAWYLDYLLKRTSPLPNPLHSATIETAAEGGRLPGGGDS